MFYSNRQSGSSDAPSPVARGNSENSLSRFTTLPPISPVDLDAKVKDVKDQISPVETFALADEFQQTGSYFFVCNYFYVVQRLINVPVHSCNM